MGNISNPEQWATRERLRFIERVVYWRGAIQREEVATVFNLSPHQISADLQKFQELSPGALTYNLKKKCYEGTARMRCKLHVPSFDEAVGMFLEEEGGWRVDAMGSRGLAKPSSLVGRVVLPVRCAGLEVQRRIFLAVLNGRRVRVRYLSLSAESDGSWRWLQPRGFGHDGYRWHVRAWCEKHGAFRDFVLSRMQEAEFPVEAGAELPVDVEWETWVTLSLVPNPELSAEQQLAVRADFGIPEGALELQVRKAMLPYTQEHLRLPGAPWCGKPFLVPVEL
jgi:hypothetical protein